MELGFFHPDRGYWQAIGGDPAALLAGYPAGTIQVSLKPGADYEWRDGAWVHVPPPPVVPAEVTRAQAKIALLRAGRLDQVETAVQAAGGEAAIWYADALTWRRDNPYVASLGAALNPPLSPADIDALFVTAAGVSA